MKIQKNLPTSLETVFEKLSKKRAFSKIDWSAYKDKEAFISHIALSGSSSQRSLVATNFDFDVSFKQSGLNEIGYWKDENRVKKTIGYLKQEIEELSLEFGKSFVGNVNSMANDIFIQYGGLTFLDCIKFFHFARMGRYKNEMQHVTARGVNREFLTDWLNKYLDEKEIVSKSERNEEKQNQKLLEMPELERRANPELLKKLKHQLRKEKELRDLVKYKNNLVQSLERIVTNNFTKVYYENDFKTETKKIIDRWESEWNENFKRLKSESNEDLKLGISEAEKKLSELEDPNSELANDLNKKISALKSDLDLTWEDYLKSKRLGKFLQIKKALRSVSNYEAIYFILVNAHKDANGINEVYQDIHKVKYSDEHLVRQISNLSKMLKADVGGKWYPYANRCIENGKLPQTKKMWIAAVIREFFVRKSGKESDVFYFIVNE